MLFRVENLGPLREAEVDLSKRLLVLTGPNNTGKTYLAWSVYGAICRGHWVRHSGLGEHDAFSRWADELLATPDYELDLRSVFEGDSREPLDVPLDEYRSQLHLCFATDPARFERTRVSLIVNSQSVKFEDWCFSGYGDYDEHQSVMVVLGRSAGSSRYRLRFVAREAHRMDVSVEQRVEILRRVDPLEETRAILASSSPKALGEIKAALAEIARDFVYDALFAAEIESSILFPAERVAVDIFAKELALKRTELVDDILDARVERRRAASLQIERRAGRYTWPIRDSLAVANDRAALSARSSPFGDLADELERGVLGGRVGVSGYGEMLFTPDGTPDKPLSIHLAASIVKSLSSLVFYFRHMADVRDFLIIDEPEMSLHPDNQRKVTQILAKAVRRGFKIMMSTHSDYVIRELDHLIMLSRLSAEDAAELGYDPSIALKPEEVGVYLFDHDRARPVEVSETGFSVETIDAEINRMQETSQKFYGKLSR